MNAKRRNWKNLTETQKNEIIHRSISKILNETGILDLINKVVAASRLTEWINERIAQNSLPVWPPPKIGGYLLINQILYVIKELPIDEEWSVLVTQFNFDSSATQLEASLPLKSVRNGTINDNVANIILQAVSKSNDTTTTTIE